MKLKSESEVAQSCLTLSDPMDCSPPGSSVHGIFQARVLEWGATAFSSVYMLVAQLCPTLCDPMDSSPPGSSVHRVSQIRIREWVANSFSRDLLDPGIEPQSPALKVDALLSEPPWKMGPNNPCLQIFTVLGNPLILSLGWN